MGKKDEDKKEDAKKEDEKKEDEKKGDEKKDEEKKDDEKKEDEKKEDEKKEDEKKEDEKKDDGKSDATANSTETKEPPKPKKKVHRRALSFKYIQPSTVASMSKDDFESSKTTIRKLDEADAERKLRDGLKNDLESYV